MKYLKVIFSIACFWLALCGLSHASKVTYVYTDPQGTPLAEADAQGNITARFDYTPYGVQALGAPPAGPGYTGHVNDPETGLVYMQARYYDPGTGRFLSADPVAPSLGNLYNFNRYAYANNNPIVNIDADGRETGIAFKAINQGAKYPQIPAQTTAEKAIALGPIVLLAAPVVAAVAPEAGAGALAETTADTSASVAVNAATEASAAAQASGATSGATSGLVTESGEVFTGASTNAGGAGAATNGTVQQALDAVAPEARSAFHGCCGEIDAASKAANSGAKLQGSTMATVRAAGRQAGKLMEACSSCRAVAEKLGIKIVEPPTSPP